MPENFCSQCGYRLESENIFCPGCGTRTSGIQEPIQRNQSGQFDSQVVPTKGQFNAEGSNLDSTGQIDLAILRQSEKHIESFCLECGYKGMFPAIRKQTPWWGRWWMIISLGIVGYMFSLNQITLILIGVAWAGLGHAATRIETQCPRCKKRLAIK